MKYSVKVTFCDDDGPKTKTFKVTARSAEAAQSKVDMDLRSYHIFPHRCVSTIHAAKPIKEEKSVTKKFYVRVTGGDNRSDGESNRWLRIKSISSDGSKLKVSTRRGRMFIDLPTDGSEPRYLRFSADQPAGRNAMLSQIKQHLQERTTELTKAQLKEIIRDSVKQALQERAMSSAGAIRRKIIDKVRTRRTAKILVDGQWLVADESSVDPEDNNAMWALDKDGGEHEVRFDQIDNVE